jgi:Transposase DDE domain group 1
LRADSGFAREALMAWCEESRVDFVFGLARNARLVEEIAVELLQALGGGGLDRQARPPLQGFPLCHARQLVAPAPGDRQGGMDPGRGQSALHRDLA